MLLAALVRAHRRAYLLSRVLDELSQYPSFGVPTRIIVLTDRPSRGVCRVLRARPGVSVYASPVKVLDAGRERFLEAQNAHLTFMEGECNPTWVYVSDDDFWFARTISQHLETCLTNPDIDAYYCPVYFIQDHPHTYNPDRHHESIRLYRHLPRVRFTLKRMLSVPDAIHDQAVISGRTARFPVPLLEYGGYSPAARRKCIAAYLSAGKSDDFTRALLSPRRLLLPPEICPPAASLSPLASSAP